MNILTISDCPLDESQGSGYVILNYARLLKERGHRVTLIGPESYEPLRQLPWLKRLRMALGVAWVVCQELRRSNYEVIEFYGSVCWLASILLSLISKRRLLLVQHSNGLGSRQNNGVEVGLPINPILRLLRWIYGELEREAFRRVDGIVTVSEFERQTALQARYQPIERLAAIDNPLPEIYLDLKIEFERVPRIGFCGSWIERKGAGWIGVELTRILKEFPCATLTLVGVGSNFATERYFDSGVCSRIEVIPFIREKERLMQIYGTMSIFMMPSYYESFGLVATEAMANGCALVATEVGFPASLVDGEEAILIESQPPHLYESVKRLLLDEGLRLRIAGAGYKRVQNLNWKDAADVLENTYLSWLAEIRN